MEKRSKTELKNQNACYPMKYTTPRLRNYTAQQQFGDQVLDVAKPITGCLFRPNCEHQLSDVSVKSVNLHSLN